MRTPSRQDARKNTRKDIREALIFFCASVALAFDLFPIAADNKSLFNSAG